jgi:tRNA threonylcarbamoyladenosine biosynthesis protein TsaE
MILADEAATTALGAALAHGLPDIANRSLLLGLSGELGSGKTTLARGLLRALGVTGAVRSPTFTLVEPYSTGRGVIHHLDLYRLETGAAALEGLGYRDLRGSPGLVIVEWPERGGVALGTHDLCVQLAHRDASRGVVLEARTESGRAWLEAGRALLEENSVSR